MANKVLAIYLKTSPLQVAGLAIILNKYPDADVIEVSTLDVAAQLNAVQALTDATYDYAYILCPVSDAGTAYTTLAYDSVANLLPKMKSASMGTIVTSGTVQTGTSSTSKATLAAADVQADDYYNGMVLRVTAGTHYSSSTPPADDQFKLILDYVGSTTNTAEVGGATVTGAYNNTDVYSIYDVTGYIVQLNGTETSIASLGTTAVETKSTLLKTWESLYPSVTRPLFVHFGGCQKFAIDAGVVASGTTGTAIGLDLTPDGSSAASATDLAKDDFLNDMYLCITSGTGLGQYRKITDYVGSTRTATIESAFTLALSTPYYRVVARESDIFADVAVENMCKILFKNVPTDGDAQAAIAKLIDNEGLLQQNGVAKQDLDYLYEIVEKGKAYFQITNVASL